jgi:MinD-like ATPase involved in chromosome partitioning or flagellar assembly
MQNKVYIIIGHYGSGKSEFSVNFAKYIKNESNEVSLADLDIVNPYFRSREVREELSNIGIDVVADSLNSTKGLDIPYLSGAIKGQIIQDRKNVILDCGGNDVGVRVLKQFHADLLKRELEMYMIVNVYRPETSTVEQIIDMKEQLEEEATLKITGLINNSNFLRQTTVDDIVYSDQLLKEVSEKTSIPIKYISGMKKLINNLPEKVSGERFILNLSLRTDWL